MSAECFECISSAAVCRSITELEVTFSPTFGASLGISPSSHNVHGTGK